MYINLSQVFICLSLNNSFIYYIQPSNVFIIYTYLDYKNISSSSNTDHDGDFDYNYDDSTVFDIYDIFDIKNDTEFNKDF